MSIYQKLHVVGDHLSSENKIYSSKMFSFKSSRFITLQTPSLLLAPSSVRGLMWAHSRRVQIESARLKRSPLFFYFSLNNKNLVGICYFFLLLLSFRKSPKAGCKVGRSAYTQQRLFRAAMFTIFSFGRELFYKLKARTNYLACRRITFNRY
jgi:hypothetical protein